MDELFKRLETLDPSSLALKQYKIYTQAAGRTAKSILISVGVRLPDLFICIEEARVQGKYRKFMKKLTKIDLLILDEFLLTPPNDAERNDLFELIQARTDKKSTIFCSQWAPEGWLGKLGNGPLADAILDRVRNSSYTILLK